MCDKLHAQCEYITKFVRRIKRSFVFLHQRICHASLIIRNTFYAIFNIRAIKFFIVIVATLFQKALCRVFNLI